MLSISPPRRAADAVLYFRDHLSSAADADAPSPGMWRGQGASSLQMVDPVDVATLSALLLGVTPDGPSLVRNAGAVRRRAAWDLTLSSPKSVSVLWGLAMPELADAILQAHRDAAEWTFDEVESRWAITRRGHAGRQRVPARLVIAAFTHHASRALDPQLHDHHLVLNLGEAPDGAWGAWEPQPVFAHQLEIGALYRARLETQLQAIGLATEPDEIGFRLRDVPRALESEFSRRRAQIERYLAGNPNPSPKAAEVALFATRCDKVDVPLEALREDWQRRAERVLGGFPRLPMLQPTHDHNPTVGEGPKDVATRVPGDLPNRQTSPEMDHLEPGPTP